MPLTNFPNGITSFGVPVLGGGEITTTGNVRFVGSTRSGSSNGNSGKDPEHAWNTIDYAVGKMTANNGDIVVVCPGHVETVTAAAGLAIDVAGITFVGIGHGDNRPQINFTTAVGADMDIDAADTKMTNFRFTGGVDALTGPIDINAARCSLINIETRDVTGQCTDFIATDANADDLLISGWKHYGSASAGAETAMTIIGGDNITIENFWIDGNFGTACIENVTTAAVNLTVGGGYSENYARTRNADDVIFTAVATTTGNVGPNISARIADNAANVTEAFVGADMQFFQPIRIVNLDGESSLETNITASTDA